MAARGSRIAAWLAAGVIAAAGCGDGGPAAVVYTSLDQRFSEELLGAFERESRIRALGVYDTEAAKTVGLAARIAAERDRPRADVFWSSEIVHTIILARQGLLDAYRSPSAETIPDRFRDPRGVWTGFAARLRIIIANADLVAEDEMPRSVLDLADPRWKGRAAIANPLFGTTASHTAALFATLGTERTERFFLDLKANGVAILPGNATVKDRVIAGDFAVGLTDTDDAELAIRRAARIRIAIPDQEGFGALLIPNTIALVRDAPHPREARALIDWILRPETEALLAASASAQIPVRDDVPRPARVPRLSDLRLMDVDWEGAADELEAATRFMRERFLE
ncbi:MAG: extracellular solute-binding protein [Planctomycetes bacterium]|nr:extracellular solute-binding protein [Planctomycetota bacterium]